MQFLSRTNGFLQEPNKHLETEDQEGVSMFYNGVNGIELINVVWRERCRRFADNRFFFLLIKEMFGSSISNND